MAVGSLADNIFHLRKERISAADRVVFPFAEKRIVGGFVRRRPFAHFRKRNVKRGIDTLENRRDNALVRKAGVFSINDKFMHADSFHAREESDRAAEHGGGERFPMFRTQRRIAQSLLYFMRNLYDE